MGCPIQITGKSRIPNRQLESYADLIATTDLALIASPSRVREHWTTKRDEIETNRSLNARLRVKAIRSLNHRSFDLLQPRPYNPTG